MAAVNIENRAQLIYLLTEAAELEHLVLCSYLFAAFTMKNDASEGISQEQLQISKRWRSTIHEIALQEMLHLASACNLLTAVGGAPQLRRPNLPTRPKAYPAAFKLRLVPFGLDALEQFIFLERPESLDPDDEESTGYLKAFPDLQRLGDIFSSERHYQTLGELYRGIEDGLKYLSQKFGEEGLFVGPDRAQTTNTYFRLAGLTPVRDLSSALAAVKVIIEQGEGASIEVEDSHYRKFLKIRNEFSEILAQDPQFEPARPVLLNPYSTLPTDVGEASDYSLIDDPLSVDVGNLFDGCYELMVQMLGRLFVHAEESEAELTDLANTTVRLMVEVIEPLGEMLTLLPAGPAHPGFSAGPSFRLSRGASIPTHKEAAWFVFHERLTELSAYCRFLQSNKGAPSALVRVRDSLSKFATLFVLAARK